MVETIEQKDVACYVTFGDYSVYIDYSIPGKLSLAVWDEQAPNNDPANEPDAVFEEEIDIKVNEDLDLR